MDSHALDALEAGLAQAKTPQDIASLINSFSLSTTSEVIATAVGAAQALDSALSIAGKGIPGGVMFDMAALKLDVDKAQREYNGDFFISDRVPAGHIKASTAWSLVSDVTGILEAASYAGAGVLLVMGAPVVAGTAALIGTARYTNRGQQGTDHCFHIC